MPYAFNNPLKTALIGGFCFLLVGCSGIGMAIGAGASAGVAAAEERGFQQSLRDKGTEISIEAKFLENKQKLFTKANATVYEDRVMLTGSVQTQEEFDEAAKIAWAIEGLREVYNELQIHPPTDLGDYSSDAWISTKLRTRLAGDKTVSDINFSVTTVNKIVYVMGIAQNQEEMDRILDHARSVTGVRGVITHIMLKDDPRRRTS